MNRNCRGCSAQTVNHSAFGKAEIWFALIAVNSTLVMKNRKIVVNKVVFLEDIRINFGPRAAELHEQLWTKYGEPQCGNSRATYISKNYVFKLPITDDGICQNEDESVLLSDDYWKFAKTKLIDPDSRLICMERVEHASLSKIKETIGSIPEFVFGIDCSQVGFNRRGQLVAYDFAPTY